MPNLITIASATIEVPSYPSRAISRTAVRNRRQALRSAIWPFAKAVTILLGVLIREVFL